MSKEFDEEWDRLEERLKELYRREPISTRLVYISPKDITWVNLPIIYLGIEQENDNGTDAL